MLRTSAEFHKAVYSPSPATRYLLKFGDTILTNEDIHLTSGVGIMEGLNLQEELTVGACPASTLTTSLMNYHGLLSDFEFGECEASMAVQITKSSERALVDGENVRAIMRYGDASPVEFVGHSLSPYLTVNSTATTVQPPFPVRSILTVENTVYCIGDGGQLWVAAWLDGQTWGAISNHTWDEIAQLLWDGVQGTLVPAEDVSVWDYLSDFTWDDLSTQTWSSFTRAPIINDFMTHKLSGWAENCRGMSASGEFLHEYYASGNVEKYEYVKLGTFVVDAPKKRRINLISVSALDRMKHFDIIADDFLEGLTYPRPLKEIFYALCEYVGVPNATMTFLNGDRIFQEAPARGENITCREVLAWIAEAACSYARMTRDGEVELTWFGVDNTVIPMNQYFSIDVAEYKVQPIGKLQIANSESDIGVIIGNGINGYQIMDNPYLYGADDIEIRKLGVPIFSRLSMFEAFSPIVARAVCDWSIQAGDVISILLHGTEYRLPVYSQTITWHGGAANVVYESTGSENRPIMSNTNRRLYQQKRAMNEMSVTVDGLSSRLTNTEGDIANLTYTIGEFGVNFVTKDGVVSAINLTPESAKIQAGRITLEGLVTVNGKFKILLDGSMEAADGKFSGNITATSGKIGGFTIDGNSLEGNRVRIDPDSGVIRLANLSIYDTTSTGSILQSSSLLAFFIGESMKFVIGNNGIEARSRFQAMYGLTLNPSDTTDQPANLWIDPSTGVVKRTTNTGGGTVDPGDPTPPPITDAPAAFLSVVPATPISGWNFYFNIGASGGVQPYTRFMLRILQADGSWWTAYDGPNQAFGPCIFNPGQYTATATVWDSAGRSSTAPLTFYVAPPQ